MPELLQYLYTSWPFLSTNITMQDFRHPLQYSWGLHPSWMLHGISSPRRTEMPDTWQWGQQSVPKHWWQTTNLHQVTSQKSKGLTGFTLTHYQYNKKQNIRQDRILFWKLSTANSTTTVHNSAISTPLLPILTTSVSNILYKEPTRCNFGSIGSLYNIELWCMENQTKKNQYQTYNILKLRLYLPSKVLNTSLILSNLGILCTTNFKDNCLVWSQ